MSLGTDSQGPFVCGTSDIISEFCVENGVPPPSNTKLASPLPPHPSSTQRISSTSSLLPNTGHVRILTPSRALQHTQIPPPSQVLTPSRAPPPIQGKTHASTTPNPGPPRREGPIMHAIHTIGQIFNREEPQNPTSTPECKFGSAGSAIFIPKTDSIEDIPDDAVEGLCQFHLSGLSGKGRVVRVIDGDTVVMLIFVPMRGLVQKQNHGRKGAADHKYQAAAITRHLDVGFYSLFSCRLLGIDFGEKNTVQGQLGKQLTMELCRKFNNYLYYRTGKFDKYGRLLVSLYTDSDFTDSVNNHFIGVNFGTTGRIVEPYDGGTKSQYMKKLQTRDRKGKGESDSEEINTLVEHLDLDLNQEDLEEDPEFLTDENGDPIGMYGIE